MKGGGGRWFTEKGWGSGEKILVTMGYYELLTVTMSYREGKFNRRECKETRSITKDRIIKI
jgi:hypothetical protein